jgi:hypothetical protein
MWLLSSARIICKHPVPVDLLSSQAHICLIQFNAGLSRLTTDEKLKGAFDPFGKVLEGTRHLLRAVISQSLFIILPGC